MADVAAVATPTRRKNVARVYAEGIIEAVTSRFKPKDKPYTDRSFNPTLANKVKREIQFLDDMLDRKPGYTLPQPKQVDRWQYRRMAASYLASLNHGAQFPDTSKKDEFNEVAQKIAKIRIYDPIGYQALTTSGPFQEKASGELIGEINRRTPALVKLREKSPTKSDKVSKLIDEIRDLKPKEQLKAKQYRQDWFNKLFRYQQASSPEIFYGVTDRGKRMPIKNLYEEGKDDPKYVNPSKGYSKTVIVDGVVTVPTQAPGTSSFRVTTGPSVRWLYGSIEKCQKIIEENVKKKQLRDDFMVDFNTVPWEDKTRQPTVDYYMNIRTKLD